MTTPDKHIVQISAEVDQILAEIRDLEADGLTHQEALLLAFRERYERTLPRVMAFCRGTSPEEITRLIVELKHCQECCPLLGDTVAKLAIFGLIVGMKLVLEEMIREEK